MKKRNTLVAFNDTIYTRIFFFKL